MASPNARLQAPPLPASGSTLVAVSVPVIDKAPVAVKADTSARHGVTFLIALTVAASYGSPAVALLGGLSIGLVSRHPFAEPARSAAKVLLQACVVGLGFGMDWHHVLAVTQSCFWHTALSIAVTVVFGVWLGCSIGVGRVSALLISVGTAICGGSAIAAIGPTLGAKDEEMSVSLGAIFTLNACALLSFPILGKWLGLSQDQFGLWAALVRRRDVQVRYPWFILLFCVAVLLNSHVEIARPLFERLHHVSRLGLSVTLFLIGSGISSSALKKLGARVLLQAIALWYLVAMGTLGLIRNGYIAL